MICISAKRTIFVAAAGLALGSAAAPASAQVRALLPTIDQVAPLGPLPIDGVWEIREINERIVIERGHAYAEDGWVHMMLLKIEPEQVVIQNIRELADGNFIAKDLPLMSAVKLEWIDDDTLRARTEALIPLTYHLERVSGGPRSDGTDRDDDRRDDRDGGNFDPPRSDNDDDDYVSPW